MLKSGWADPSGWVDPSVWANPSGWEDPSVWADPSGWVDPSGWADSSCWADPSVGWILQFGRILQEKNYISTKKTTQCISVILLLFYCFHNMVYIKMDALTPIVGVQQFLYACFLTFN